MKKLRSDDSAFEELTGFHEEIQRLIRPQYIKNKTVLDIGSGFGWCEHLFSKFNPQEIIGIEPSDECLKVAKQFKHPQCKFIKGTALKLPFKDNTFDTIMSWEVLEHIPKNTENVMFKEIYRVLKPGGDLFLSTQYNSIFSTPFDPAWYLVGHRHYSRKNILKFTKDAGLIVKQVYTKGGFFTILGNINMYGSKWILRRNRLFNDFFIRKTKEEYAGKNGFVNIILHATKPKKK